MWATDDLPRTHIRWWYEKADFVLSIAPGEADIPIIEALEGKIPSALKHPTYSRLENLEAGAQPVGRLFVDLSAFPPLPPQAHELGLDGVERVEARWGIQDKGIVVTLGVNAPRPRRGILMLFDQPPIKPGTSVVAADADEGYTLMSIDPTKTADAILALVRHDDPDAAGRIDHFAVRFQERSGLSLRNDLLAKLGPQMALLLPAGRGGGSMISFWFHPPDFVLVAELKDARGFSAKLDRLVEFANRELKAAGALVRPQPGQPSRPGTEFAEFRRLKAPEQGYVLAVPPSVLPTPAGLRPTVIIEPDRGVLVLAGSPTAARRGRAALVLNGPPAEPVWGHDALVFSRTDPVTRCPNCWSAYHLWFSSSAYRWLNRPAPRGLPDRSAHRDRAHSACSSIPITSPMPTSCGNTSFRPASLSRPTTPRSESLPMKPSRFRPLRSILAWRPLC